MVVLVVPTLLSFAQKLHTGQYVGLKIERIWANSSETLFVTIFFPDLESERVVCGYEYRIRVYR
jgi:hypothetical protein